MTTEATLPGRWAGMLEAWGLTSWFAPAGLGISPAEALAVALGVAMVLCNLRVNPWGWPLAICSALLYAMVFAQAGLLGQVALQALFIAVSAWGWYQWRRQRPLRRQAMGVGTLSVGGRWTASAMTLAAWPAVAALLQLGGGQQPWLDALPTVGSITAQILLVRKRVESWPLWLAVNALSMVLFARQGLWPTVMLYALFALLSVAGWRAWWRLAQARAS